jgi:hypothetical protein
LDFLNRCARISAAKGFADKSRVTAWRSKILHERKINEACS